MIPDRDVYQTPRCPSGHCLGKGADSRCPMGRHERIYGRDQADLNHRFTLLAMFMREPKNEPPLVFMPVAGIALMVNSEHRSLGPVPLNWFEQCPTCGAGTEGCPCEPNILAILAREEGGSEWQ